jgi:1-aminocyclopropane-1-carboxylate deaminase/D-cysteine desulfhydrase-like pyridoxal-dependent ACC family enzyme
MTASLDWVRDTLGNNRVALGATPTPLDRCDALGREIGVELYLKREDLIDGLGCGNKVRRLGYQIVGALAEGATVIVAAGSLQSNQCKAIAAYAPHFGLRAHVVYAGDAQKIPEVATGNYLVTALMQPTVTWYEGWPWRDVITKVDEVRVEEERRGNRVYVVGAGGMPWPGLLGSIELGHELFEQLGRLDSGDTHVVAVAGTGETCAGLRIASGLLDARWRVHGIVLAGTAETRRIDEVRLLDTAAGSLRHDGIRTPGIEFFDGAAGLGYDQHREEELTAMSDLARRHGLLLDPNYMLKAYLGLRQLVLGGVIPSGSRVVLIHSGGQFGVFADTPSVREHLRRALTGFLAPRRKT